MEFDTFHQAYTTVLRGITDAPTYRNAPRRIPVVPVRFAEPLLGDVPDHPDVPGSALDAERPAEAVDPPFLIVTGVK